MLQRALGPPHAALPIHDLFPHPHAIEVPYSIQQTGDLCAQQRRRHPAARQVQLEIAARCAGQDRKRRAFRPYRLHSAHENAPSGRRGLCESQRTVRQRLSGDSGREHHVSSSTHHLEQPSRPFPSAGRRDQPFWLQFARLRRAQWHRCRINHCWYRPPSGHHGRIGLSSLQASVRTRTPDSADQGVVDLKHSRLLLFSRLSKSLEQDGPAPVANGRLKSCAVSPIQLCCIC